MKNLCMNCMAKLENQEDICPHCNESVGSPQSSPFVPTSTLIADRYLVGKGLEMDGEGLSYVGFDVSKNSKVYIREFYPSNLCTRKSNHVDVQIQSNCEKFFKNSLAQFLKYFRSIARLRNLPSIVSVYDIIEQNGTAYIICQWIDGQRLSKFLSTTGGYLEWDKAKLMFMPLISSLSRMHSAGVKHLGICPDNIIVTEDNELKLTGLATANLRSSNSVINSQLYDGCSALEQYLDNYEPSESTDVYGLAATMFLTLTGEYPPSAPQREKHDRLMIAQNVLDDLPEHVVSALAVALRVRQNGRTISFESLKIELLDSPITKIKNLQNYSEPSENANVNLKNKHGTKSASNMWGVISCAVALVILLAGLAVYWFWLQNNTNNHQRESSATQTSDVNDANEPFEEDASEQNINKMPVPNLVGQNFESLQKENVANLDYKLMVLSEEMHDSIGEGCIVSQTPSAGEEMEKGATIAVNISKGGKTRVLPEISGKTLSEASQLVTNAKLIPKATGEFSHEFGEGIVIGYKNKKAGDTLDYGSEVIIVVSKGLE